MNNPLSMLDRYMKQKNLQGPGDLPQDGMPMGPGIADPFKGGSFAPPMTNPEDAQNEFDPRRQARPYMGGF
jgi:hypothetical protein